MSVRIEKLTSDKHRFEQSQESDVSFVILASDFIEAYVTIKQPPTNTNVKQCNSQTHKYYSPTFQSLLRKPDERTFCLLLCIITCV